MPARIGRVKLVGCFVARISRPFGRSPLRASHTFWWRPGSVERSPSIGSWCRALEFFSPSPEQFCWSACTKRCHLSRCPRSCRTELSLPAHCRSTPRLLSLVPCYVAVCDVFVIFRHPVEKLSTHMADGRENKQDWLESMCYMILQGSSRSIQITIFVISLN